jgi:H+/Cl- antiporter ClcA
MSNAVRPTGETTVTSLVSGIVSDAQELIKQQAALLRAEVREDLRKDKEVALLLAVGALLALTGTILVVFGIVYLLHWAFPALALWACFLFVGGLVLVASAAFLYPGIRKFQSVNPFPDKSVAALREILQWRASPK